MRQAVKRGTLRGLVWAGWLVAVPLAFRLGMIIAMVTP